MNKLMIAGAIALLAMLPAADPADAGGNGTRSAGKVRAQASTFQPTSLTRASNGNGQIYRSRPQSNGSVQRSATARVSNVSRQNGFNGGNGNVGSQSDLTDWRSMAPIGFSTGRFFELVNGGG